MKDAIERYLRCGEYDELAGEETPAGRLPRLAPDLVIFGAIEEGVRPHR